MKKPKEVAEEVLGADPYLKKLLEKATELGGEADQILSALGERVMAKDEYSRAHDQLREKDRAVLAYKTQLDNWYNEKVEALSTGETAKAELAKLKAGAGGTQPPASSAVASLEGYVKKDEIEKYINERVALSENQGLTVMTQLGALVGRHHHTYGEPLDTNALVTFAREKGVGVAAAYDEMFAEKAKALTEKRAAAERKKLEEEIREQVRKEMGHGAYPVGPQEDSSGNTLSGLKQKQGESDYGVQAAINEYYRMSKPPSA